MAPKRIVYLLGAGATHAEILTLEENAPDEKFRVRNGLQIKDVSKRVMRRAQRSSWFKENKDVCVSAEGSLNIELLISLLETNQCPNDAIEHLKNLVRKDIDGILSKERKDSFYLHKALFELHRMITKREVLLGIISLNYDDVVDVAYTTVCGEEPSHCFTSESDKKVPVLKLHGSFDWKGITIRGRLMDIPIMPIGINKNYLVPPYNFIWGRAYELLMECDVLRILGCSLNQNDLGLIDLLFKAHLARKSSFKTEIIDMQPKSGHHQIKSNYGFFPDLIEPMYVEGGLMPYQDITNEAGNPFRIWLKAKAERMLRTPRTRTKFLKKSF